MIKKDSMKLLKSIKYNLFKLKKKGRDVLSELLRWKKENQQKRVKFPETIQLPITYLCNFDCVMCGMHHMVNRKDFSARELGNILGNELFSKVKSVGVNGGEPFLKPDMIECIDVMIDKLPLLEQFYFISNGFYTDKIVTSLKCIKEKCNKKGIKVNISISVDGINDMQDFHRGKQGAFVHAEATLNELLKNRECYFDQIDIICTITKYNIERINEVEAWANSLGVEVAYNIATANVRIENEEKLNDFSIFSDEHARMLATEFFYYKYLETGSEKYFGLYLYLTEKKRYATCDCQNKKWVTLTPDSQISFCATYSNNLGSALENSAYELFNGNDCYLDEILETHCETCSHYMYSLNAGGLKKMHKDQRKNWFLR